MTVFPTRRKQLAKFIHVLLVLFAASILFFPSIPQSAFAANQDERITGPVAINPALTPGTILTLVVNVSDIGPTPEDLDGWEVHVRLNATVLKITGVRDGPVLDEEALSIPGGDTLDTLNFNPTEGTVSANEFLYTTSPPLPSNLGFTGSGDLFYIDVEVLVMGWTFITLSDTKLRDVDVLEFVSINHRVQNGAFSNVDHVFPPTASFTVAPQTIFAGNPANFDATASYDLDGTITRYYWDFGDGFQANETDPTTAHAYATPGSYDVTLTVTDADSATNSTRKRLTIANPNAPPVAVFTFSPGNPRTNEPVVFNATGSFDPDGRLALPPSQPYLWDFGDGGTFGGRVVEHVFARPGTYDVVLTVIDDRNQRGNSTQQITVTQGTLVASTGGLPSWALPAAAGAAVAVAAAGYVLWRRRPRQEGREAEEF